MKYVIFIFILVGSVFLGLRIGDFLELKSLLLGLILCLVTPLGALIGYMMDNLLLPFNLIAFFIGFSSLKGYLKQRKLRTSGDTVFAVITDLYVPEGINSYRYSYKLSCVAEGRTFTVYIPSNYYTLDRSCIGKMVPVEVSRDNPDLYTVHFRMIITPAE